MSFEWGIILTHPPGLSWFVMKVTLVVVCHGCLFSWQGKNLCWVDFNINQLERCVIGMRESASVCLQMNGFDIKDVQGRYYASLPSLFVHIYSIPCVHFLQEARPFWEMVTIKPDKKKTHNRLVLSINIRLPLQTSVLILMFWQKSWQELWFKPLFERSPQHN